MLLKEVDFIATNLKTPCVSKRDEDFLTPPLAGEDKRLSSRLKLEDTPTVRSGSFIVEKTVSLVGEETWKNLPDGVKRLLLFDKFCPAGGDKEEKYHDDGPRYWERPISSEINSTEESSL